MEPRHLSRFRDLVASRTGLRLRDKDAALLARSIVARARALSLNSLDAYRRFLETDTQESETEWRKLVSRLTNGESYFFRDRAQMRLLRETILPDIVRRNAPQKRIRVWSAGCSTGEEPYSLAILLQEVIPDIAEWSVTLLATDVDEEALAKARGGLYRKWSFRNVEPALLRRHFHPIPEGYQVSADLRCSVSFRYGNLFTDRYPDPAAGLHEFDLILCRNVFIYFDREAIRVVLHKFADSLCSGGWLVTGHAELNGQPLPELLATRYPESIVYRRKERADAINGAIVPSTIVKVAAPPRSSGKSIHVRHDSIQKAGAGTDALRNEAEAFAERGAVACALSLAERALHSTGDNRWALLLSARLFADSGRHDEAVARCRRAIEREPTDAAPYRLLAHIADEQGDAEAAKRYLRKVIFLEPGASDAYLHLAELFERGGDSQRARTLRTAAMHSIGAPLSYGTESDGRGNVPGSSQERPT